MPAGTNVSADKLLADAVATLNTLTKRMDALETGEGHKNPITKGDARPDDDDRADNAKSDDDNDDTKDDATVKTKILADDDDDDAKDDTKGDAFPVKKKDKKADSKKADSKKADDDKRDDDGELEIKHKKSDAKKDAAKADAKRDDDDDDDRCDAEEEEKEEKDDSAKADSIAPLRAQISAQSAMIKRLEAMLRPRSDEEHDAFAEAQAKADAVFNGFGQRAPRPLDGEELFTYRKRLANKLKMHSPAWKNIKFSQLPEEAFGIAENQVYADAVSAAANPVDLQPGELRAVTKRNNSTGGQTIEFFGKESFVKRMGRQGRRVASFRTVASV
jgi:hypothetical protein